MSKSPIQELRDGIAYVSAALSELHVAAEGRSLTDDEQTRWDDGVAWLGEKPEGDSPGSGALRDLHREEARADAFDRISRISGDLPSGDGARSAPNFHRSNKDTIEAIIEDRSATPQAIADGILRSLAERDVDDTHTRQVLRRHRADTAWARNLLVRSTDVYATAWAKMVTGREFALTPEERAAIAVGTNTQGGFLVPTHLDPTIILTNDGSANIARSISRVVTLTEGNVWNGVASAGVTASWDPELTEVSDDSPSFTAPSVTVHKAQVFAQATIEAVEDAATGLGMELAMMFADARDRLEGAAHMTGSGSDQPFGIFTALDANTNVELTSTTAATIGLVDLQGTRAAVPVRWRGRGSWVMNPTWADEIKRLGTALSASYSTDITQSNTDMLLGRPVYETDDAPEVITTTVADNRIVFGDFSNYVIVDKPGSMSVHYIPPGVLQNTNANLPDGRVGWYAYWRTGADSVNDLAFRLLQDKTSA